MGKEVERRDNNMGKFTLVRVVVGLLQANCYLYADCETKEAVIIDPGSDGEKIVRSIEERKLNPVAILNTHYHFDHTCANKDIKERFDIPLMIGKEDAGRLQSIYDDAMQMMMQCNPSPLADNLLREGDIIKVGRLSLKVIETPGHTEGSVCFYDEYNHILFSGDTLFLESVGRTDLPTGNTKELMHSLKKLFTLPLHTTVYAGHGDETTLLHELKHNPFVKDALS